MERFKLHPVVQEFQKLGTIIERIQYSRTIFYCGVYLIVHLKTSKCYIGSHHDLYFRKRDHKYQLERQIHNNDYLQAAYNDDPNFIIMLIVTGTSKEDRELGYDKEQHILNLFYTGEGSGLLFNIGSDARSSAKGRKQSPETIAKKVAKIKGLKRTAEQNAATSKRLKGRTYSPTTIENMRLGNLHRSRAVYANGVIYDSIMAAMRATGFSKTYVKDHCNSHNDDNWYFI